MAILILSLISFVTTVIGLWYISEKKSIGFVYFTVSLITQAIIFYSINNNLLVVQMLVLIGFNIYNFFKWRKDGNIRN